MINKVNTRIGVEIHNRNIPMLIDSGADVNIVDENTFTNILSNNIKLCKTEKKLYAYKSSTPLELLGKFTAVVESSTKMHLSDFFCYKEQAIV